MIRLPENVLGNLPFPDFGILLLGLSFPQSFPLPLLQVLKPC